MRRKATLAFYVIRYCDDRRMKTVANIECTRSSQDAGGASENESYAHNALALCHLRIARGE
jgi:hypothetical protein